MQKSSKVLGADSLKTNQNTRRSHKVLKGLCVFQSKVSPTLDSLPLHSSFRFRKALQRGLGILFCLFDLIKI